MRDIPFVFCPLTCLFVLGHVQRWRRNPAGESGRNWRKAQIHIPGNQMSAHLVVAARNESRWHSQRVLCIWMFHLPDCLRRGRQGFHNLLLQHFLLIYLFSQFPLQVLPRTWASQQQEQESGVQARLTQTVFSIRAAEPMVLKSHLLPWEHVFGT